MDSAERRKLITEGVKELGFVLATFLPGLPPYIDKNDLISEAYVAILEATARFDPSIAQFKTYVSPKLRGVILNYLTRFVRYDRASIEVDIQEYSNNGGAFSLSDRGEQADEALNKLAIQELISHLSLEERILIELHYARGQTHRQIAKGADMEPSTVTRTLQRALGKIRLKTNLKEH